MIINKGNQVLAMIFMQKCDSFSQRCTLGRMSEEIPPDAFPGKPKQINRKDNHLRMGVVVAISFTVDLEPR